MIRQHLLPLTKENANEQYVPSSPISLGPLGLLGPLRPLRGRVSEIVRNHLNCLNRLIGLNCLYFLGSLRGRVLMYGLWGSEGLFAP